MEAREEMSYRFLVIGCGSIGERHIKNLRSLGQEVWVWDINPERLKSIQDKYDLNSIKPSEAERFDAWSSALLQTSTLIMPCIL